MVSSSALGEDDRDPGSEDDSRHDVGGIAEDGQDVDLEEQTEIVAVSEENGTVVAKAVIAEAEREEFVRNDDEVEEKLEEREVTQTAWKALPSILPPDIVILFQRLIAPPLMNH